MGRQWQWVLLLLTAMTGLGCAAPVPPLPAEPARYVSVWAQLHPRQQQTPASPGSLQGEFQAAAAAREDPIARERWQRFVDDFDPKDGYFEDAMHARLVAWAKMELRRLQHRESGNSRAEEAQIANMRRKAEVMN